MHATLQYTSTLRSTRLSGLALWIARGAWLLVALLIGSMFAASLSHVVSDVYYYEWSVLQAREAASSFFPDYAAFVQYILVLRLLVIAIFWLTAFFIAWRKPDDWMVLFVSATLLMMSALFVFRTDLEFWRFPAPLERLFPAIDWAASILFVFCFLLLLYLFPDGRFTPGWLRWVPPGALLFIFTVIPSIEPLSPDGAWTLFLCLTISVFLAGIASQAYRWRRANQLQKQQSRLVVTALVLFIFLFMARLFLSDLSLLGIDSWIYFIFLHVMLIIVALIPLTIGISVLRYRLWGMDALLNRTLVAGLVTAAILIVYVLVVSGISFLFQTNVNLLMAAFATGIVALLVHPLRQYVQKFINRLMYGERDDPLAVLAAMGRQVENTAVPGDILPALVETIAETLKLPYVAIETTNAGRSQVVALAAANGGRPPGAQAFRLAYQGETVGDLIVAPRAGGESFTVEEERLLRSIARQAGTAVYAYQITSQLQRSRERLVTAREEERLRLRRDLHDGLGPQLATLNVKIDAARNLLDEDPEAAERLLAEVKAESQMAIAEIRRVVDDLRPSALDQLGFSPALQELVNRQNAISSTTITLELPDALPPLPAAVEVAAYRIISEAVSNMMKYAGAKQCKIRLHINDCALPPENTIKQSQSANRNQLCIEVIDDGSGLPVGFAPGIGLSSMRERSLELGGTFAVESDAGIGTAVRVTLPLTQDS